MSVHEITKNHVYKSQFFGRKLGFNKLNVTVCVEAMKTYIAYTLL